MIEGYTLPEMGDLWSEEAKFRSWLEVEIAATAANGELGRVPAKALATIREHRRPLRCPASWRSRRRCATT